MPKQSNKPTRRITSLDSFTTERFTAVVEIDDEKWEIPCREMTYVEFHAVAREVPQPKPPEFAGPSGKIYDYQDAEYQRAKAEADQQIALRRVAAMMDFPHKTIDEKLDGLKRAPMALVIGLTAILTRRHFAQEARIEALSHSFQPNGSSNHSHPETNGVAVSTVVEPTA